MNKFANFYLLIILLTTVSCATKKHLSSKEKIVVKESVSLKSEIESEKRRATATLFFI